MGAVFVKPGTESPRTRIKTQFAGSIRRGEFLVGAAIGAGILGQSAEQGGADFVLALGAGRFRIMGAASVACMLPIRDSNEFVKSFAPAEILSQCSVPVYFGASTLDPTLSVDELADQVAKMGFSGVINFPTVAHFPEPIREALDTAGIGFSKELALFAAAHARGLSTLAHVRTGEQARASAALGVDIICFNFGWNAGGAKGLASELSVEEAAAHSREISRIVTRENPEALFVLEGGPIEDPDHLASICRVARIHGYVGGSTIDRLPLAESVTGQTLRFKSAAVLARVLKREERNLVAFGHQIGLAGTSEAMVRVYEKIRRFSGSNESMIVSGEVGTGRQTTVEALHTLSGQEPASLAVVNAGETSGQQLMISIFGRGAVQGGGGSLTGLAARDDISTIAIRGIDHIPLKMQARIAVYLERGRFTPIGGRRAVHSGKRLLFIANAPLESLVAELRIDPDLAQRIEGHEVHLPSLRDRSEDIEELLDVAIARLTDGVPTQRPVLSPSAMLRLRRHDWTGNLPELRAFAAKLVSHHAGGRVDEEVVQELLSGESAHSRRRVLTERDIILDALWRHGFHRGRTASFLGISRKTLYNKIRRYALTGQT